MPSREREARAEPLATAVVGVVLEELLCALTLLDLPIMMLSGRGLAGRWLRVTKTKAPKTKASRRLKSPHTGAPERMTDEACPIFLLR